MTESGSLTNHASGSEARVEQAMTALMRSDSAAGDDERLTRTTIAAVRPWLVARSRRAYRRQVALAMTAALLPLPLIVAYDRALLEALYVVASSVLPGPLPAVAVGGYAVAAVLLLGATYAAIPLLVDAKLSTGRAPR
jgi:hypothetical protein